MNREAARIANPEGGEPLNASPGRSRRYHTLDGLRGVGALSVVLLHFAPSFGIAPPAHGYLAVDLFFCLSGFVLTRSYLTKIEGGMTFGKWISVRLIRLYPLFGLSIILGLLTALVVSGTPGSELSVGERSIAFVTGMLMLPSPTWWAVPEIFPLNAPGWSLFVEMLLSILFFRAVRFRTKSLWTMLAGAFVALILLRLFIGYLGGGFSWRDGPSGLVRGVYGFSAGLLIARLPERSPIRTQWAWLPIVVTGALLAINPPHGAAYDILLIVLVLPAITLASVRLEPVAVLPFRTLGDLSYAIYALHSATFFTLQQLGDWHPERPGTPLTGLTALALFLVGCWIIDRYYDCPVRRYLTRKSQGPAFGRRVNG